MGSGKSTVGKMLASKLGLSFVDTDFLVEERAGRAIKDIFKKEGENHFRRLEKQAVAEVSSRVGQVIACGGGVVLDEENARSLKKNGVLIYLRVSPSAVCQRTEESTDRPLLNVSEREAKIKKLLCAREEVYEQVADLSVNTSVLTPGQVANEIEEELMRRGVVPWSKK